MDRDDITRMAREAGYGDALSMLHSNALERFANLVAAAEREACAKVCTDIRDAASNGAKGRTIAAHCAIAIRERGAP